MNQQGQNSGSFNRNLLALALGLGVALSGVSAVAAGKNGGGGSGGGGGGSVKVSEGRVTGYVTAIDYVNKTITIGASYYGSGVLKVDSNTKISMNTVNCTFEDLKLGDWIEARYDFSTRTATKLSGTGSAS
ncbi:MAG: hypothetical protein IT580_08265 [Verrucomicrobiales bacterium]|nr:hypothetical protein [Verrucomicrobiales bacterium]